MISQRNASLVNPSPENQLLVSGLMRPLDERAQLEFQSRFHAFPDPNALWEAACRNKVQSVIGEVLKAAPAALPGSLPWVDACESAHLCLRHFLTEMDRLSACLAESSIQWIILENGALARSLYPRYADCFQFGDFDLLVHPRDIPLIDRILLGQGYRRVGTDYLDLSSGRVEYQGTLDTSEELGLNIQTSFVARRWFFSWREPRVCSLFAHANSISGSNVLVLCPEDFLLQLCVHNASHGYIRKPGIRLHMDIDWYLGSNAINWPVFVHLVEQLDLRTVVYYSLLIPKTIFSTKVPDDVLETLKPSPLKERWFINYFSRHKLLADNKNAGKLEYALFSLLLFDHPFHALRLIFPETSWMRQRYGITRDYLLPIYHLRRWFDLAFHRLKT